MEGERVVGGEGGGERGIGDAGCEMLDEGPRGILAPLPQERCCMTRHELHGPFLLRPLSQDAQNKCCRSTAV
eukprot:1654263-Rhodomonas_salina.2